MHRVDYIKSLDILKIDGINYGNVIATEIYDVTLKNYIKQIVKCLFTDFNLVFSGTQDSKCLFFYSMEHANRQDYNEIKKNFMGMFPWVTCLDSIRRFSIHGLVVKIVSVIRNYLRFREHNVPTPFLCGILVTEYLRLYSVLNKAIYSRFDLLVSFCDSHPEDNLLTQIMKTKATKTVTLQHGQYRILNEKQINADAEAYKNFISDFLLAWGEATKDEFVRYGINEQRIILVGALKPFSFIQKLSKYENHGVFGIVLSGDTYAISNVNMIKMANVIAQKYRMRYFVRFHPRNNLNSYMKYIDRKYLIGYSNHIENNEYVSKVDFSIIHMTGVFVELLALNSIILVFKDDYLEPLFNIPNYTFSNIDQFSLVYKNVADNIDFAHRLQYHYYRYFNIGGDIKENYVQAMNRILNS